jgi:cytochrome c oxidase subunit 2
MSGVVGLIGWMQAAAGDAPVRSVSIFDPASPGAEAIVRLGLLGFAVAAFIFVIVEGILFYTIFRFRAGRTGRGNSAADAPVAGGASPAPPANAEPPQVYGSNPIEVAWTVAPAVIVFFLVLVSARTLWEVNAAPAVASERRAETAPPVTLEVRVIARQWWWEYQYKTYDGRELNFITANELHIPVSDEKSPRHTKLILESADVCHSFWVPRLEGKMDVIPGLTNILWLQTNESGLFLGQCAEYCGTQHAHMLLRVVAEPPSDFEAWLENQAKPAVEDAAVAEGKQAFLSESCVNCHRIRGTVASGNYAPDLTHLMSRETLASGMIALDEPNLRQWIHDPQEIKPGCLMPAFGLDEAKEEQIVRYLLTLK